mgnify:CR=1 FL=1
MQLKHIKNKIKSFKEKLSLYENNTINTVEKTKKLGWTSIFGVTPTAWKKISSKKIALTKVRIILVPFVMDILGKLQIARRKELYI